jgi:hypothetical protein
VRGGDNRTGELFSYVDLESRVRRDHPLQAIQTILNEGAVGVGARGSAARGSAVYCARNRLSRQRHLGWK